MFWSDFFLLHLTSKGWNFQWLFFTARCSEVSFSYCVSLVRGEISNIFFYSQMFSSDFFLLHLSSREGNIQLLFLRPDDLKWVLLLRLTSRGSNIQLLIFLTASCPEVNFSYCVSLVGGEISSCLFFWQPDVVKWVFRSSSGGPLYLQFSLTDLLWQKFALPLSISLSLTLMPLG